jgi:hypothetical protein
LQRFAQAWHVAGMNRPLLPTLWLLSSAVVLQGCPGEKVPPPRVPTGVFLTPQGVTSEQTVFVRGLVDKDSVAEVFLDGTCKGTPAVSGPSGNFAAGGLQVVIPANTTTLIAARARRGDLTSACSEAAAITHDDQAPGTPTIAAVKLVGVAPLRVEVTGVAEAKARVRLYFKPGCVGENLEAKADAEGKFVLETQVAPNATTVLSADASDPAGNTSGCSAPVTFVHDDIPPAPPVLTNVSPGSPNKAQEVTVSGTAEPAAQVRLYRDSTCNIFLSSTPAVASVTGAFSQTVSVPQNTTTQIFGRATDAAGNSSSCSAPVSYTHDGTPPVTPTLGPANPPSPSNATTFTLEIAAEAGSYLQLYGAAGCAGAPVLQGTVPAGGAGLATLSISPNTTRSFSARSTDQAGNVSNCSNTFNYTNDSVAPAAPVLTGTTPTSPGNVTSPQIHGTTEGYAQVQIFRGTSCSGTSTSTTANGAGVFSASLSVGTSNTTASYTARATDAAGNVSPCSNVITYTHDGIAPAPPQPAGTLPPSPSRSTSVELRGLGEPGATAQAFSTTTCTASSLLGTAVVAPPAPGNTSGRGPFSIAFTVPAGSTTPLAVNQRDPAGNTSTCVSLGYAFVNDPTRGWRDIVPLDAPGTEGYGPSVLASAVGATAVWARLNGTASSTLVASDYVAGTWSAPAALTAPGNHLLDPVRLAADGAGNLYAVWSQYGAGATFSGEVFGARRPAGGPWGTATSFGPDSYEPDVAAGPTGEVVAAFRAQVTASESQIHVRRFVGAAWDAPVRVDTSAFSDFAPRVAVTSTGEGLVLFTENSGTASAPNDSVWTVRFAGGSWQAPQKRSLYRIRRGEYALQSSGPGRAVAAWLEAQSSTSSFYRPAVSRYTSAGFGSAAAIGSSIDGRVLTMGANANDAVMVVYGASANHQLAFSRASSLSAFFTSPVSLWSANAAHAAGSPVRVAHADDGSAVAAWIGLDRMETGHALWFSTWSGSAWSAPQMLEPSIDPLDTFDLAVTNDRVVATWSRTDGAGTRTLRARTLD